MTGFQRIAAAFLAVGLFGLAAPASAQDTLRLAIGQRGNWDTAVAELGQNAGIFKKHGLVLDIKYTQGTGETVQAVASGSFDIGIAAGTTGVMSAFTKGAPLRAISAGFTGASDLFYYVPASSPIHSLSDAAGKTVGFSTSGSSSNTVTLALLKHDKVAAIATATGGPAATYTQVMSNQIDVGWSSPPFGLDAAEQNKIRIVARGSDVPELQTETVRLNIANLHALETKKPALERFVEAYGEALDWMYDSDAAPKAYAAWVGVSEPVAKRARDEFYPRAAMAPGTLTGLDALMADAVTFKYIAAPLTAAQQGELFQFLSSARAR